MKIALLYGTESGNTEMLCDDIAEALDAEHQCEIRDLSTVSPTDFDADTFYVFLCSTFGNGDLPSNAEMFVDNLETEAPSLGHVTFCMFGLGDSVFADTFAHGSETLLNVLLNHGAVQIGERGIHDASTGEMPEDIAIPWVKDRLAEFLDRAA
ncbi:MAG: flavodoxin domain-containing protein [Pseudomonadota bacterium]